MMRKLYNSLITLSDAIFRVEKWLLLLAVIAVTLVNFLNVVLRYALNSGLAYCEMLSIVLFMFMVIIGGNIAVKTDSEIRIDIINFKSERKNAAFRLLSDIISIIAIILAIIGLCATIQAVIKHKQRVTPLPIYTYHIYICMLIGFVMILLDHFIIFLRHILIMSGFEAEREAKTE